MVACMPTPAMRAATLPILNHADPRYASAMPIAVGVDQVDEAMMTAYLSTPVFASQRSIELPWNQA